MRHFINLADIPTLDLRKIINDAKKRKSKRKKLNLLIPDKDIPLKGKFLIQMFEKSSLRTRLSFYLAIRQLGGGALNLRKDELHFGEGGESIHDTAKIISNYGDIFMLTSNGENDKILQITDLQTTPLTVGTKQTEPLSTDLWIYAVILGIIIPGGIIAYKKLRK